MVVSKSAPDAASDAPPIYYEADRPGRLTFCTFTLIRLLSSGSAGGSDSTNISPGSNPSGKKGSDRMKRMCRARAASRMGRGTPLRLPVPIG